MRGTGGKAGCGASEGEAEHAAYAPRLRAGIEVVDAMHVLYVEYLEDVVYARYHLYVGLFGIHHMREGRKGAVGTEGAGKVEQTPALAVA